MLTQNEKSFSAEKFESPDVRYAPLYAWVWNYICTKERIDAQLDEMQRLGIRAFYIVPEPKEFRPYGMPTELSPDYLSEGFFEMVSYALRGGRERGMYTWIYDEGGWPSGGACGQVLKAHPEYARRVLSAKPIQFAAGEQYKKSSSDILAAFVDGVRMIDEGYVFENDSIVTEYAILMQNGGGSDFPDLLNKDSTDYFINITHDGYASVMSDMLGDGVFAVFTDEPKAPQRAFNMELKEEYGKAYGESVLPHLPLLYGAAEVSEENVEILYRWYDLCSRTFCENFMLPCRKWANEHGMAFTGHLDKDHDALGCMQGGDNFHLMRALRCMDIPGVDVIWKQIYPESMVEVRNENNGCNGFFPRYASSAARQNGGELALTESMGVMGPGATYGDMRYVFGYQAVRGVNVFNFMTISMGRYGGYLGQELPSFTEDQIYYRDLPQFNKYLERLSYVSALGDRMCDTALYYPMRDIWGRMNAERAASEFELLGRTLEDRLVDFDIIDDDIISSARDIESGLIVAGKAAYRNIVIPQSARLSPKTLELLEVFEQGGGRVTYTADTLLPAVETEGDISGLRVSKRAIESGELILLFCEAGEEGRYCIKLPKDKICLLSLEDGTVKGVSAPNGILTVELAWGETAAVMLCKEDHPITDDERERCEFVITSPFVLKREKSLACSDNGFYDVVHNDGEVACELGAWDRFVGVDYSGSCVYKTEFSLSDEMVGAEGEIDLGAVSYSAKVELNGVSLGSVLAAPYRLRVPNGVLHEKNTLNVTVTNTSANWYLTTDYFDKYDVSELSPYFDGEMRYAKDSLDGGLYGPVKLFLTK